MDCALRVRSLALLSISCVPDSEVILQHSQYELRASDSVYAHVHAHSLMRRGVIV